jgi:hypothetical protein
MGSPRASFAPPGGQAGPGAGPGGAHPCEAFVPIRADTEKAGAAIKAASARKATREEVCPLFKNFTAAEAKMVSFLDKNQKLCGVPPDAVKNAKTNHVKTVQVRNQICSAGPGPRGPSLSDAFGGPLVSTEPPKTGRGTFDTLTGPVAR